MNKRWLAGTVAAALLCCGCLGRGAAGEGTPASPTVYLRVVARNDSAEAQAEKRRARDAVWAACPTRCADPQDLLPLIQDVAASFAPCQVDIRRWTPGGGVPSAPTVYIRLGEGNGHNWWGILYKNALLWARIEEDADERDEPDDAHAEEWDDPDGKNAARQDETDEDVTERDGPDDEGEVFPEGPGEKNSPRRVEFVWPILTWLRGLLNL